MSYSRNEIRRKNKIKRFVAWCILLLIGLSIGITIVSGFIHLFFCSHIMNVSAAPEIISEEAVIKEVVEEPIPEVAEPEPISLGEFKLTAYCACEKCCGEWADGITYTETIATEGRTIAVDPNVIPLGSEVVIDGHTYVAEDIGGAIKGNKIDLYFDSHQAALEFGVQHKEVFMKGV